MPSLSKWTAYGQHHNLHLLWRWIYLVLSQVVWFIVCNHVIFYFSLRPVIRKKFRLNVNISTNLFNFQICRFWKLKQEVSVCCCSWCCGSWRCIIVTPLAILLLVEGQTKNENAGLRFPSWLLQNREGRQELQLPTLLVLPVELVFLCNIPCSKRATS